MQVSRVISLWQIKKVFFIRNINVSIISIGGNNYKIKIEKDYENMKLFKNDLSMSEYQLFSKYSLKLCLGKDDNGEKILMLDKI